MTSTIHHPFSAVYAADSEKLILGTMPSPVSRKNNFYYGHPQNRFWQVLGAVFGAEVPATNEAKREFILARKLALFDVLSSCRIAGAADSSIQNAVPNDFSFIRATKIRRVYCTGQKSWALYTRLCRAQTGIDAVPLPSTSPANRRFSFDALVQAYAVLRCLD